MNILSKYKDYYDYLVGIYGRDEKLVLDRRKFTSHEYYSHQELSVYVCGMVYDAYYDGEKFYYGEQLYQVGKETELYNDGNRYVTIVRAEDDIYHNVNDRPIVIRVDPYEDSLNYDEKCPIIVRVSGSKWKFHPLNKISFGSAMPPDEIFMKLTNWLSDEITEKEKIIDTRSENQRIESRGFDAKRSFRPKMK